MGSYVPSTIVERKEMLTTIGLESFDELFSIVPTIMKLDSLDLPEGKSELEVTEIMSSIASKNKIFPSIFRGAGAYHHYIPSIVKSVTSKEEFLTAYTPYQAELSQGLLQSIFEYQTMICEITGMDASNASVYDGASAAAEATAMCRDRKRSKTLVSSSANPMTIQTIQTYATGADCEVVMIPTKDGKTDLEALSNLLDSSVSSVYIEQPNYYGQLEVATEIGNLTHESGGKFIMGVNPIACAILKTPVECGADIAVGEGQPLGMPLSFGGPYLGFMTCTKAMMRKLPGRIVGETIDIEGKRAYVLTLQAREQHIRREKASSNICSNQALCALTSAVHMTALGSKGLKQVATICATKAHYTATEITNLKGFQLIYAGEFFHEFLTSCPIDANELMAKLEIKGILGGYPIGDDILWCVTEMNSKAQIEALILALKEVCEK